jgi:P27 family predicted phage terminase small subunit
MTTSKPPAHLSAAARALFRSVCDEIELDAAALLLLVTMCEQFDRMHEARRILKRDGITTEDRFGQKRSHPACIIERDAAAGMMRAWRLLGFDQAPSAEK